MSDQAFTNFVAGGRGAASADTHRCPRPGCDVVVSNRLFCCSRDWWKLPYQARTMIQKTARLSLLARERRAAIRYAMEEWRKLATT